MPKQTTRTVRLLAAFVLLGITCLAAGVTSPVTTAQVTAAGQGEQVYDSAAALTTPPAGDARGQRNDPVLSRSSTSSGDLSLATKGGRGLPWAGHRPYAPNRELPRYPSGRPKPESPYPHTQLGTRKGRYPQSREFDANGRPVRDIDWTDHGKPDWHTDPHQHVYGPDGSRGGPGSVWP